MHAAAGLFWVRHGVRHDTTGHTTGRPRENGVAAVWRSEQRGIQSCTINRKMATDHQLCSPRSRMYTSVGNDLLDDNECGERAQRARLHILPLDTADERRAQERCCRRRDVDNGFTVLLGIDGARRNGLA